MGTWRARGVGGLHAGHGGRHPSSTEVHCEEAQGRTKDEEEELAAWSAGEIYDEITGAALPSELVRQARAEEIKFMLDWGVWERALITDC